MYFIGAASPVPPQIYDPHYLGSYARPEERPRVADLFADGRWGQLPLVVDHGVRQTGFVPENERIGIVLWLFVASNDELMAVGRIDARADEIMQAMKVGQRWGLSLLTQAIEDGPRVKNIEFWHLGVTRNPDGGRMGAGTWIRQYSNNEAAIRRVLRETYATDPRVYMPAAMKRWLDDSEPSDRIRYTPMGGLAGRNPLFSSPSSFVCAMADTPVAVPPPQAPPQPPAPNLDEARVKILADLAGHLPKVAALPSLSAKKEALLQLQSELERVSDAGVLKPSHFFKEAALKDYLALKTKVEEQGKDVVTKFLDSKVQHAEMTADQAQAAKIVFAQGGPDGQMLMAQAEEGVRTQSRYEEVLRAKETAHSEKEKQMEEEMRTLKRRLDEMEKSSTPAASAPTSTPAGLQGWAPALGAPPPSPAQRSVNQATTSMLAATAGSSFLREVNPEIVSHLERMYSRGSRGSYTLGVDTAVTSPESREVNKRMNGDPELAFTLPTITMDVLSRGPQ
jgi:hypothetical protein